MKTTTDTPETDALFTCTATHAVFGFRIIYVVTSSDKNAPLFVTNQRDWLI
jgi:hypothetical protein